MVETAPIPLSHQTRSSSSSVLGLFWFQTGSHFWPQFCFHRQEPDWSEVMTLFLIFGTSALNNNNGGLSGRCLCCFKFRSQIKLKNDFSNVILFPRVQCFIVYLCGSYRWSDTLFVHRCSAGDWWQRPLESSNSISGCVSVWMDTVWHHNGVNTVSLVLDVWC